MKPGLPVVGLLCLAVTLAPSPVPAQVPRDTAQAAQDSALRVFLDCPDYFCDFDYYHTEITFVNYVRDRQYAQVHILLTSQGTGGGGREFTLTFIGRQTFAGTADTLRFVSENTATGDEIRAGIARTIRLGLIRFVAKSPVAERIQISYSGPAHAQAQVRDPWNYWVFRIRMNGSLFREKRVKYGNLFGTASASRVTDNWKITLSANESYRQNDLTFDVVDSTGAPIGQGTTTTITRSYGAEGLIAKSLGPHWSAGVHASLSASTFSNQDRMLEVGPAIEFDVFPYPESTRRLLTLRYAIGVRDFDYRDTTIYDKIAETLVRHELSATLDVKQPWGSAGASLEGRHYLNDLRKNRLELFAHGDFRLFKGLSFNCFGSVDLIHDQLFIPKGAATEQEVLLQRRQLQTSYRYEASFGLSYTFGSKFSNIVNPRFRG